jgi:hypothetical protein
MHQIKGFISITLAIAAHAFDFMASLNINCSMSKENANKTSRHHYWPTFWGCKMQL